MKVLGDNMQLRHVLGYPFARKLFEAHLDSEYSGENLRFCTQANEYEKAPVGDLARLGNSLVDEFVADTAATQINIKSKIQKAILSVRENETFARSTFADAKEEIWKLMEKDNFQRFKKTKQFHSVLERVGAYSTMDGFSLKNVDSCVNLTPRKND